tara:strand:- start:91957 stop:92688 length:732 start_codon:yes stop_codon:yes gene_type:complete
MPPRPILFVRSLLFSAIFYPITVPFVLCASLAAFVSESLMRWIVTSWGRVHRFLCRLILRQKVEMIGDLPQGQMLYIFKHESMFETIDLLCMFDAPIVIAKRELVDIPGWGWIAQRHGMIGLERSAGANAIRHLQRQMKAALATGRPICLFPEGTRVPHGQSPPIKAGFAALYKLLNLPVVPIALNSGLVSPRRSFIKKPGTVTYVVGEIIPPGLPRDEAEARAHAAINALNTPAGDGLEAAT